MELPKFLAKHDSSCVKDNTPRSRTNVSCQGIKLQGLFTRKVTPQHQFFLLNRFKWVDAIRLLI